MSLAAHQDLDLHCGDFSVAFLKADAIETVYMEQVPGYETHSRDYVLLLNKGLYGTKTANRGWQLELHCTLPSPLSASLDARLTMACTT